jgi:phenylpropionate dioxygenase-like ring-hydroxylating dioxygenase large terminal subunit
LTCKFHGWTYTPEERLVGVPEEDMFFEFQRSDYVPAPVATDVWEGFIFINLDPHPQETLREYLGKVVELLRGYPFDQLPVGWFYTKRRTRRNK